MEAQRVRMVSYAVAVAGVAAVAAIVSEREDWRPVGLLAALAILNLLADTVMVRARRIYVSAGLVVQVMVMALLGPAPAVAVGVAAAAGESKLRDVPRPALVANVLIFSLLGLIGGLLFDAARSGFGIDRHDAVYAVVVALAYAFLAALNLVLVASLHPLLEGNRWRVFRETGVPVLPWELVNAVMAGLTVLVWAHAGLAAVAGMIVVLVISIPLLQALGGGIESGDDRDRLLSELLVAERRERGRLAESLHDGPLQRLAAIRLSLADGSGRVARELDAAIEETRAIVASLHPALVHERGFEASIRAAAAPFRSARGFDLTVRGAFDDRALADTPLLPIAQELVINAAKHARATTVAVTVAVSDDRIALEVADNGIGVSGDPGAPTTGHGGLTIVRRRVRDAGGSFELTTGRSAGSCARVALPIGP